MSGHTTMRDALFAEMLGEVDDMLRRIEHLPVIVDGCEKRLSRHTVLLEEAGERYGQAVSGFTQAAKTELSAFLESRTRETVEEQAAAIRQLVLSALETESGSVLSPYRDILRKTRTGWFAAHGVTALCASVLTAMMLRVFG